jgi:amidase
MAKADLDLCYMTATEAIGRFRRKSLSPVELLDAVVARSEQANPKLNAYTYTFFERARAEARKAERLYAKGRPTRPLEGVPVVIKDYHDVKGEITTYGSRLFKDHVSDHSAPTVERLLAAGAIMFARTTTPEMAYAPMTKSELWGITRNPWNLDYSPGGSSGGAAAAVAAGMTTLADGTDGGGSIRIPASTSGVFGYKPPFGRNPIDVGAPRESLIHFGPLTRSVADGALMQNVTAGPHTSDMCSLRPKYDLPDQFESIRGWKIAFSMDLGYYEIDTEVQKNTRNALAVFKSLGCTIKEVDPKWSLAALDAWYTLWEGAFWGISGPMYPRWKYGLEGFVRTILERGSQHDAGRYYRAQMMRGEMYQTLAPILESHDVFICPTTAAPGIPADHDVERTNFRINGKSITGSNRPGDIYVQWQLCYPFNLIPECPVASVPSGFAKSGVPTGIQIVGRTYDDLSVFRAAAAYEKVYDWRRFRPNL